MVDRSAEIDALQNLRSSSYLGAEAESRGYQARMLMGMETLKATGCERDAARHFHARFDRVRDRIEPRTGGDEGRKGQRQLGIEEREDRRRLRIAAGI